MGEEEAELAMTEVGWSVVMEPEPERGRERSWSRYFCFGEDDEVGVDVEDCDDKVQSENEGVIKDVDAVLGDDSERNDREDDVDEAEAAANDDDGDDVVNDTDRHGGILTEIRSISFTAISTATDSTCPATVCAGDVTRLQPNT